MTITKDKIEKMREIVYRLHKGETPEKLRNEFRELLASVAPWEIPLIEQELVRSGIPAEEIAEICDLHVELFREFLGGGIDREGLPVGHPLRTLLEENDAILADVEKLSLYLGAYINAGSDEDKARYLGLIRELVGKLLGIKRHFVREQMLLFPYLERVGITAVPTVLWIKQDEVYFTLREIKKYLDRGDINAEELAKLVNDFARIASDMVFRENNIFLPTMAAILGDAEWYAVKLQEDKIGYYPGIEPGAYNPGVEPVLPYQFRATREFLQKLPNEVKMLIAKKGLEPDDYNVVRPGDIKLDFGYLSREELDAILKTLPVELTFVGADGRTRYFTNKKDMVFVRTPSVIGRKVEFCHPPRSIELVKSIVKAFRNGREKPFSFWVKMGKRTLLVEYHPVKDDEGTLLGILEVVFDVTEIRRILESGKIPYFQGTSLQQIKEKLKKLGFK